MKRFDSLMNIFNILKSSIQSLQYPAFSLVYLHFQYICMFIVSSLPQVYFYTQNSSLQDKLSKKVRDVSKGRWGGGFQKSVHMTFLVEKRINM